jgi:uncharacterized coiled-coil DUF342 family protein
VNQAELELNYIRLRERYDTLFAQLEKLNDIHNQVCEERDALRTELQEMTDAYNWVANRRQRSIDNMEI